MSNKIQLIFSLFCLATLVNCDYASVKESFLGNEVVPDLIDEAPESFLKVVFPSGANVNLGNELVPEHVKDIPTIEWKEADPTAFYTLIMTDPDAPSRAEPKFREWHHWIVGNIPGNNLNSGDTLSEFISSAPPKDSGLHRYVYLLFKQEQGKVDYSDRPHLIGTSGKNRGKFSTRDFVAKYKLGKPVAGNLYQAEWDEYVPKVYEKLKD